MTDRRVLVLYPMLLKNKQIIVAIAA